MTNFSGAKFLILISNMGLFTTLISQTQIWASIWSVHASLHCCSFIWWGCLQQIHLSFFKWHFPWLSILLCYVDELMTNNDQCLIFSFKSDNCSQQYKSCFVFANWRALAKKYNKTIILYYGVSGHGKGLVDSMSCFRVKGHLWKTIITENFFSMM